MSNITPQHKNLNQGAWKNLEDAVRAAVKFRDSLFVITGTIYNNSALELPNANEAHEIPAEYFKIIYNLKGEAASFLMEQSTPKNADYCSKKKIYRPLRRRSVLNYRHYQTARVWLLNWDANPENVQLNAS